jgi:hypothetical protein
MLTNPGFEGSWTHRSAPEVYVADGWEPWWHANDTRPEYKRATPDVDPRRVRTGNAAQQWFNSYATHTAGIYQIVPDITPGATLILSAYIQAFSRNDDANFAKSDGRYRMRVGIDPYGGTNPESKDIVWGPVFQPYDSYVLAMAETIARSDRCTVFIWGQAEWRLKHNNAYVDDITLEMIGAEPEPEPEPNPSLDVDYDLIRTIVREEIGKVKLVQE